MHLQITPEQRLHQKFVLVLLLTIFAISVFSLGSCERTMPSEGLVKEKSYKPTGILLKSLPEIIENLDDGTISSEQLVNAYLERISQIDDDGPQLQSILSLNPHALQIAKKMDELRQQGAQLGPLHGVPIVLKDNIESRELPTTAGSFALKDNWTKRDAPFVTQLKSQGAIILGKSNLSEWANFRSERSMSGWSGLGGQTRNPHILDRNPCGSSSGSAVATAASLSAAAIGTETNGSIICPASVNGVVGFKPTVGLVSQKYIIPISPSQDTAGPITKTVMGAALLLNGMATKTNHADFVADLNRDSLKGKRIGVLRFAQGDNPDIIKKFNRAIAVLKNIGAVPVEIETYQPSDGEISKLSYDLLLYEFKHSINAYLAGAPQSIYSRNLDDLIAFNRTHNSTEMPLFGQEIFIKSLEFPDLKPSEYATLKSRVQLANGRNGIDFLLSKYDVSALIAPSGPVPGVVDPINGDVWPSWAGAGSMAARAGYPHLSVPMGFIDKLPVGLSFIGGANTDAQILSFGFAFEQESQFRRNPTYLPNAQHLSNINKAMVKQKPTP